MERSEWFARRRATIAYYSRFGLAIVSTCLLFCLAAYALKLTKIVPLRFKTRDVF